MSKWWARRRPYQGRHRNAVIADSTSSHPDAEPMEALEMLSTLLGGEQRRA